MNPIAITLLELKPGNKEAMMTYAMKPLASHGEVQVKG